jgi:hypothetical protein
MFDRMLRDLNVVITPGAGFGAQGEGYFPRFRFQQSRERPESSAPFGETVVVAVWAARHVVGKHISDISSRRKRAYKCLSTGSRRVTFRF